MKRGKRPELPGMRVSQDAASMIRVDHAGEYGAVRIYEGQLAVLGRRGSLASRTIHDMARQEREHLRVFDRLLVERRVRPTILSPLWHVAGFALGAGTALLGEKAAMACTAAVEEVIDEHYAEQLTRIAGDDELKGNVSRFRDEEIAHRDTALAQGAEGAPAYPLLSAVIKGGCRLAIALSKRL
jgi:ubiquinone biosynthesis monooxygenase Coq7